MRHLYHSQVEIMDHLALTAMSTLDFEQEVRRRLAYEFVPFIEKNMQVSTIATNPSNYTRSVRGSMVMMPLEEYRRMLMAAQQFDDRFRGLEYPHVQKENVFRPLEPKKEFDAVDYLKQLMKKNR